MDNQNLFQPVLDDDEQVVKVLRPHRGRAWFNTILCLLLWSAVLLPVGIMGIVCPEVLDDDVEDLLVVCIIMLSLWAVVVTVSVTCIALWCHKTVYAWTNKRVLIRTGYIGVDYKSLDLAMVGALSVNVNVVDKLFHKNTGTIAFGSMASPMTNQNVAKFNFTYIFDPYKVYKEVKAHIDQKKTASTAK